MTNRKRVFTNKILSKSHVHNTHASRGYKKVKLQKEIEDTDYEEIEDTKARFNSDKLEEED